MLNHGACAAIAAGAGANNSTLGARAAITAGASAMYSTTAQVLQIAGTGVMNATNGARDAITTGAGAICFTTGAGTAATAKKRKYSTTGAGAAVVQELDRGKAGAITLSPRSPQAYLAPLLTDECRSTVGPQGREPQHYVLTCVS